MLPAAVDEDRGIEIAVGKVRAVGLDRFLFLERASFHFLGHRQTVKLSPQPHDPVAFGFSKTKPAAKSSSRQSMIDPTR